MNHFLAPVVVRERKLSTRELTNSESIPQAASNFRRATSHFTPAVAVAQLFRTNLTRCYP
jgi:hypothetical protein